MTSHKKNLRTYILNMRRVARLCERKNKQQTRERIMKIKASVPLI